MDKIEFLSKVNETYQEYQSVLASLSGAKMLQPGTCGDWAVKDVIAHVTWYEREMVGVLKSRALVGSDWWNLSLDQRNAAIYESNKDLPLAEVLSKAESVHRELLKLLASLTDMDLLDASHFREMPPDWIPWEVIASNTFEHYPDHVEDIRKAFLSPS
jgi:uncharacterized protein (TIGR03083 family)